MTASQRLVANFTVDVGSDRAGIRWYEIAKTGASSYAIQQGTLSAGPNYATTFVGGKLIIKAPPTPGEINNAIVLVGTGIGLDDMPGLFDGERNTRFGIDFPERPEEPLIAEDPLLDDPVASGGDASVYGGANVPPAGDK